jgi:copper oxidase (laccase) domain-containing protein
MDTKQVGLAGLRGWRGSVADVVAEPVARRSSFGEDQIRAVVGAAFLILAVVYIVGAVRDLARDR